MTLGKALVVVLSGVGLSKMAASLVYMFIRSDMESVSVQYGLGLILIGVAYVIHYVDRQKERGRR